MRLHLAAATIGGLVLTASAVAADGKLGPPTAGASQPVVPERLAYHDGTAESRKSVAGAGEFISFALPGAQGKVSGIRVHCSRYGYPQPPDEDATIYFTNHDFSETVAVERVPYARFQRGPERWVTLKFPRPVDVPKDFWVGIDFHAERTKGVYVSIDTSTKGSYSKVGLPGETMRAAGVGGDWMIEVLLAP